jgi:DNA-binding response OmpR family regulator
MKILIIEDHEVLRSILAEKLYALGYEVFAYECSEDIIEKETALWDVLLLDVNLPGEDGFSVAKRIRANFPKVGIVFMTVKGEISSRIVGYDVGADYYLPKPFEFEELRAILASLERRLTTSVVNDFIDTVLYLNTHEELLVNNSGKGAKLSTNEFKLLMAFACAQNQTLEYWQIELLLFVEGGALNKNALDIRISRLRKKLNSFNLAENVLVTIKNYGYIFKIPLKVV